MTTTVNYNILEGTPTDGMVGVIWDNLSGDSVGQPMAFGSYADKTVQVSGTVDADAPLSLEGSNDGDNWNLLTDNLGNDLSFVGSALALIVEAPRYIRPNQPASASASIKVIIIANKS